MAVWASPAIDLYYVLYMVASDNARHNHQAEIIETYHKEFVSALKKIGLMTQIPTLRQLQVELLENKFIEVVLATCFLPYVYVEEPSDDKQAVFRNTQYVENIKRLLPELLTSGALD